MARAAKTSKNGKDAPSARTRWWQGLLAEVSRETARTVAAILLALVAVFFSLAPLGLAGPVGATVFRSLSQLVGWGYLLFPLLGATMAAALVIDIASQRPSRLKYAGAALFALSALMLLEFFVPESGGIVGATLLAPLVAAFGRVFSGVLVSGLALIGLLLVLETHLRVAPARIIARLGELARARRESASASADEAFEESGAEEEAQTTSPGHDNDAQQQSPPPETETAPDAEDSPAPAPGVLARARAALRSKREEPRDTAEEFIPISPLAANWEVPPLSILKRDGSKATVGDTKANANIIKRTLENFGIVVEMDEIAVGPTVTRYALKPAEGVRLSRIVSLQSNLELALAASPIRIEAPIPGRPLVGIEVPNQTKATVGLYNLLTDAAFQKSPRPLLVALGRDIAGQGHYADITRMPHLLVAGATGSGKSVTIHALVASLLYRNSPEMLRFIMVDPKRVELTLYNDIPHLLTPVITDAKKAILALKWAIKEMERRYGILEAEQVRDIHSYHKNIVAPAYEAARRNGGVVEGDNASLPDQMPYIVVIVDELADLMQTYPRELEAAVVRLAQMSRAVGIHLILSTQRPSVNVITGLIKANIPTRIALQVSSQIDSRTILDQGGAEKLLGAGDMLYLSGDRAKPVRLQAPFISEEEVKKIARHWRKQGGSLDAAASIDFEAEARNGAILSAALEEEDDDGVYEEAKRVVLEHGKASTSLLQRKLRIGYSRAARIMDLLEERGIIGPADGSKPREVLPQAYDTYHTAPSSEDEETPAAQP
ncbi:MAG: hypothetical protein KatS3mg100_066 [Candidatus Parcubacteria bacterium]|nr:MAG: hypothetical protein KatS3mg100_066 [Candidatus Parcubacteria bacterium]